MRRARVVAGALAALAVLGASPAGAHPAAEERIDGLTRRIEARPDRQALYVLRGAEFARQGEWDSAARDFEAARKLGDPDAVAFELGRFHYRRGEHRAARAQFDRYLRFRPGSARAVLYRARASARLGDSEAAVADYERYFRAAADVHPGDFVAAAELLASAGGVEDALALLDRGLERLGPNVQLQRRAVELESGLGRHGRAVARWRRLEPALGQSPEWRVALAELHLAAAEPDEARRWLDAADARLAGLRPTQARRELRARAAKLRAALASQAR